jgi:hypothetical protein
VSFCFIKALIFVIVVVVVVTGEGIGDLGWVGGSYNLLPSELLLLLLPKSSCLIDTRFDVFGLDCRKLVLFLGLRGEVIIVIHRQAGRQQW